MSNPVSPVPRDSIRALHDALESTPGGIAAHARRIGRTPAVLYNKFSEANPHNEIGLREALALAHGLPGTQFVDAVCSEFGGVFVPVPQGPGGDDDLLEANLEMVRRFGQLAQRFLEARADGVISPVEFARIDADGHATIQAVLAFVAEVQAQVREVQK